MKALIALAADALLILGASPPLAKSTGDVGSGTPGFADGPAERATFIQPAGVAYDGNGNVVVADAGAQRIRRVSPAGDVTTVAGGGEMDAKTHWVSGALRDGSVGEARCALTARRECASMVAEPEEKCGRSSCGYLDGR